MFIGLFIAIFSEKEYTASCTMVPQSAEGGSKLGGSLGGLAAMAGINLGSMTGGTTISPILYPKIVNSIPFQKELMKTMLDIEGQESKMSYSKYYLELYRPGLISKIKKYTLGLPFVVLKVISNKDDDLKKVIVEEKLLSISKNEQELIDRLSEQFSLEVYDKEGYVTLSVVMPEAKAAAQMAEKGQELLQKAICEFKIRKAREQLMFIEQRFIEKEKEAKYAQEKLAVFRDRNRNVSTATAQTELEQLTAEYNLIYGVYSELAKQLETQKIQVKENTPIFTLIEPVTIPFDKSSPKRGLIILGWIFLGLVIGIGNVFYSDLIVTIKNKWASV